MSGSFSRVSGSAGPAGFPTVFFGAMPDQLTMLSAWRENNSNFPCACVIDPGPTQFISAFVPNNTSNQGGANHITCSFSAAPSIIAPDGSTNTTHLTESSDSGNTLHYCTAGHGALDVPTGQNAFTANIRYQAFVKAAERTRCGFGLIAPTVGAGANLTGVRVIFDLASGQIGVPQYKFDPLGFSGVGLGTCSITPWPNGWYLISMEWLAPNFATNNPNVDILQIFIDSGSGTGAESTNYTGNGTSGIYVWKAAAMPVGAYAFAGTNQFFDDFNNPATYNSTNSGAPGFNFYSFKANFSGKGFNGSLPGGAGPVAFSGPPAVVSGGTISLTGGGGVGPPQGVSDILMAVGDGTGNPYPGGFIANSNCLWQPPVWISFRVKQHIPNRLVNEVGMFALPIEGVCFNNSSFSNPDGPHRAEYDFFSAGSNFDFIPPISGNQVYPPFNSGSVSIGISFISMANFQIWNPTLTYNGGDKAWFNGKVYSSLVSSNTGNQPDLTLGTSWQINTAGGTDPTNGWPVQYVAPYPFSTVTYDPSVFNAYDFVWIPWNKGTNINGITMNFTNGIYTGSATYNPNSHPPKIDAGWRNAADSAHWFSWMGSDANVVNAQVIDYVRIRK